MKRYDVSIELAEIICKSESDLLDFTSNSIGFPAVISWICKQSSEHEVKKLLRNPLQSMSDEVALLKSDLTLEEGGKYLILAYMSLKNGRIDVKDVDKNLFDSLKKKYVPGFVDKDLGKFVERMIGYYLLPDEDCSFVYDSNILKKIVFVSVAKENALFVQRNCKNEYLNMQYQRNYVRTIWILFIQNVSRELRRVVHTKTGHLWRGNDVQILTTFIV